MHIERTLIELGLSANEVKIYLAILDLGMAPLSLVARKAGLKRPTTYGVVKKLRKRGFTECFLSKGIRLYSVISPKALHEQYAKHLKAFEEALPQLEAKHEQLTFKPKISFLEGKKELERLYHHVFSSEDELLAYVLPEQAADYFSVAWLNALYQHSGFGKKRWIVADTAVSRSLLASLKTTARQTRFVAPEKAFSHEIFLRDKQVFLFSFHEGFALRLESADAAETQRSLFEMVWDSAR